MPSQKALAHLDMKYFEVGDGVPSIVVAPDRLQPGSSPSWGALSNLPHALGYLPPSPKVHRRDS